MGGTLDTDVHFSRMKLHRESYPIEALKGFEVGVLLGSGHLISKRLVTVSSCSKIWTRDQGNRDVTLNNKDQTSLERFFSAVFPRFAQKELGAFALFALCGYWNGPKKTGLLRNRGSLNWSAWISGLWGCRVGLAVFGALNFRA